MRPKPWDKPGPSWRKDPIILDSDDDDDDDPDDVLRIDESPVVITIGEDEPEKPKKSPPRPKPGTPAKDAPEEAAGKVRKSPPPKPKKMLPDWDVKKDPNREEMEPYEFAIPYPGFKGNFKNRPMREHCFWHKEAIANENHMLRQLGHSLPRKTDNRALGLGVLRMKTLNKAVMQLVAKPVDLRVATTRHPCSYLVENIEDAVDEPNWKTYWREKQVAHLLEVAAHPEKQFDIEREEIPSQCSTMDSTAATSPNTTSPESANDVEVLINDIVTGLQLSGKKRTSEERDASPEVIAMKICKKEFIHDSSSSDTQEPIIIDEEQDWSANEDNAITIEDDEPMEEIIILDELYGPDSPQKAYKAYKEAQLAAAEVPEKPKESRRSSRIQASKDAASPAKEATPKKESRTPAKTSVKKKIEPVEVVIEPTVRKTVRSSLKERAIKIRPLEDSEDIVILEDSPKKAEKPAEPVEQAKEAQKPLDVAPTPAEQTHHEHFPHEVVGEVTVGSDLVHEEVVTDWVPHTPTPPHRAQAVLEDTDKTPPMRYPAHAVTETPTKKPAEKVEEPKQPEKQKPQETEKPGSSSSSQKYEITREIRNGVEVVRMPAMNKGGDIEWQDWISEPIIPLKRLLAEQKAKEAKEGKPQSPGKWISTPIHPIKRAQQKPAEVKPPASAAPAAPATPETPPAPQVTSAPPTTTETPEKERTMRKKFKKPKNPEQLREMQEEMLEEVPKPHSPLKKDWQKVLAAQELEEALKSAESVPVEPEPVQHISPRKGRHAIMIPVDEAPAPPATRQKARTSAGGRRSKGKQEAHVETEPPTPTVEAAQVAESPEPPRRGRKKRTQAEVPLPPLPTEPPKKRRGRPPKNPPPPPPVVVAEVPAEETSPAARPKVTIKFGKYGPDVSVPAQKKRSGRSNLLQEVFDKTQEGEFVKQERRTRAEIAMTKKLEKMDVTEKEDDKAKEVVDKRKKGKEPKEKKVAEPKDVEIEEVETKKGRGRQKRTSARAKKEEKMPPPMETRRAHLAEEQEQEEVMDDDVSVDTYNYEDAPCSSFSEPPVQYQFSPGGRRAHRVLSEPDPDVEILSPPQRRGSDDIQVIEPEPQEEEPEVKREMEDDDYVPPPPMVITDAEYDEDGEDDPPLGASLIYACDYLRLDEENEIAEDYVPFPPETMRVDAGVFAHFVRALSLRIYNIRLPRMNYRYVHYPIDFIDFFKNVRPAEITERDIRDPLDLVNQTMCHMSLQATHLLTNPRDHTGQRKLVTSNKFKELIKMFQTQRNSLVKDVGMATFGTNEGEDFEQMKNVWNKTMDTVLLRICDSLVSMAKETTTWQGPVTDNVFRRRFETLLIGWRNFILRGGPLKTYYNFHVHETDNTALKKIFDQWFTRLDNVMNEIRSALEIGPERRANLLMEELERQGHQMRWFACRQDVGTEQTELHRYKCRTCNIYFTNPDLLRAHNQVHAYSPHMCDICFLDFTHLVSLRIHHLQRHFREVLTGEIPYD